MFLSTFNVVNILLGPQREFYRNIPSYINAVNALIHHLTKRRTVANKTLPSRLTSAEEWCLRNQEIQWYESYVKNFNVSDTQCIVGTVLLNRISTQEVMGSNPGPVFALRYNITQKCTLLLDGEKTQAIVNTVANQSHTIRAHQTALRKKWCGQKLLCWKTNLHHLLGGVGEVSGLKRLCSEVHIENEIEKIKFRCLFMVLPPSQPLSLCWAPRRKCCPRDATIR